MFSPVSPGAAAAMSRRLAVWWLWSGRVALAGWFIAVVVVTTMLATDGVIDENALGWLVVLHGLMSLLSPYLLLPVGSPLLVARVGDRLVVPTVLGARRTPRPVRRVTWISMPGRYESLSAGAVLLRSGWRWVAVASLGYTSDIEARLRGVVDLAVEAAGSQAPVPRGVDGAVRSWRALANGDPATLFGLVLAVVVFAAPFAVLAWT